MYKVRTTIEKANVGRVLYEKGCNASIPLEKSEQAIKAARRILPELEAYNEAVKLKVSEYNVKLEEAKKEHGEKLPVSILEERDRLTAEIEAQKDRVCEFSLSDEEQRSFIDICENAKKVWYKAIQDRNECATKEAAEKITAPSVSEFALFSEFIEELKDAERTKKE